MTFNRLTPQGLRRAALSRAHRIDVERDRVLAAVTAVAQAGKPCPSWREIGEIARMTDGLARTRAHELVARGKIAISDDGRGGARVVTIISTGHRTAPMLVNGKALTAATVATAVNDGEPPPRVDRDPCFRCGVRGDIGCGCRTPLRLA